MLLKKIILFLFCFIGFAVFCLAQSNRLWATYYGGAGDYDIGRSISTDSYGNVYLAGSTTSDTGIALGGFQNYFVGIQDAFLVKFDSSGNRLWASYYGGADVDNGVTTAVDELGNIYLGGYTYSDSGIALNGFQNIYGGSTNYGNAFLVKFDSSGNRLWATYYGGAVYCQCMKITTDSNGNVYMCGHARDDASITINGFQNNYGGGNEDAFLVKFDTDGNRLWATYYGGVADDLGYSVATDTQDNVYLFGRTGSNIGISSGGFQNSVAGFFDNYLVKFDSSGNRIWATYYGGTGSESGGSVTTDLDDNVYITGSTTSTSGIASNGFQNVFGGPTFDAYVAKFNSDGERIWATYYGGETDDTGNSITSDSEGNIFLNGLTYSLTGISSPNGFQESSQGFGNDYLAKFNSNGMRLCSTYYGPYSNAGYNSLTVDYFGNIYMTAYTDSISDIAYNGFQNNFGGGLQDAYLVKFSTCTNCETLFSINISQYGDTLNSTLAPNYQWYLNDTVIPGATNQSLIITQSGYYYVLTTSDSCSFISNIIETTCLCVGVNENEFAEKILIYPNPASTFLTIETKIPAKLNCSVNDLIGRVILEMPLTSTKTTIDISTLSKGVYFVVLFQNNEAVSRKKIIIE